MGNDAVVPRGPETRMRLDGEISPRGKAIVTGLARRQGKGQKTRGDGVMHVAWRHPEEMAQGKAARR